MPRLTASRCPWSGNPNPHPLVLLLLQKKKRSARCQLSQGVVAFFSGVDVEGRVLHGLVEVPSDEALGTALEKKVLDEPGLLLAWQRLVVFCEVRDLYSLCATGSLWVLPVIEECPKLLRLLCSIYWRGWGRDWGWGLHLKRNALTGVAVGHGSGRPRSGI